MTRFSCNGSKIRFTGAGERRSDPLLERADDRIVRVRKLDEAELSVIVDRGAK